ncbi:uncharacterized protein ACR2FA_000698 [Aphomia sociella]
MGLKTKEVKEDTNNYMEYKILNLQEKQKNTLRLRKGVLPHKFQCQNVTEAQPIIARKGFLKRKHLEIIEGALSAPFGSQRLSVSDSSSQNYLEAGAGSSSSHVYIEYTENKNACEAGSSTSLSNVYSENKMHIDKAIEVNSEVYCESKSVNMNLCGKTKSTVVSRFPILSKTTLTPPFNIAQALDIKIKLFQDNADIASISSGQPSLLSSSPFEPDTNSPESSWNIEDDSEKETQFKNQMRSCMLTAVQKEPEMLLGLPRRSYYLIKILSENIPLPTIDILITLKKIKLNESFSILALQFGYTQSTVSTIFSKGVLLLAEKMKKLIVLPTPAEIFNNLPISFRARYSNVVSIIDYLEIEIEKPSNVVHQSLTWSQFKKCNTLKYLISYTPDGLVNFISDGYSGRAMDVMIIENCGFLKCLPFKTAVMADRDIKNISYLLEKKDCILIRPPSVYKSTPISKEDANQSKRIAALRIHVEHVINRLREFHMLLPHARVNQNLIPIIDDVIVVACGLINIQDILINKYLGPP